MLIPLVATSGRAFPPCIILHHVIPNAENYKICQFDTFGNQVILEKLAWITRPLFTFKQEVTDSLINQRAKSQQGSSNSGITLLLFFLRLQSDDDELMLRFYDEKRSGETKVST